MTKTEKMMTKKRAPLNIKILDEPGYRGEPIFLTGKKIKYKRTPEQIKQQERARIEGLIDTRIKEKWKLWKKAKKDRPFQDLIERDILQLKDLKKAVEGKS